MSVARVLGGVGDRVGRVQDKVDEVYKDQKTWNRMSVMSTAGSGFFSSDRTIREYVEKIWKIEPMRVPVIKGGVRPVPEDRQEE